jgi:hypothetical protein
MHVVMNMTMHVVHGMAAIPVTRVMTARRRRRGRHGIGLLDHGRRRRRRHDRSRRRRRARTSADQRHDTGNG